MHGRGLILAGALALAACASTPPASPVEAWTAYIASEDALYDEGPTAILKIADSVYLEPGQAAALLVHAEADPRVGWTLERGVGTPLLIRYEGPDVWALHSGFVHQVRPGEIIEPDGAPDGVVVTAGAVARADEPDAVRLFAYDDRHPAAAAFDGLDRYPYDPAWVIDAEWRPRDASAPVIVKTERNYDKRFWLAGEAVFIAGGLEIAAPLYSGAKTIDPKEGLFLMFTDPTNGTETYGTGRYLNIDDVSRLKDGRVTLDFNYVYNPYCARSPHYNCPHVEWDLPVAVTAGEKAP